MNNLNLIEIFSILIIHFIGDFVLQTDKQSKGKSKNWNDLLSHTFTYSITFFGLLSFLNPLFNAGLTFYMGFYFFLITFICHTITDYFTSRLNSKLWQKAQYWSSEETQRLFTKTEADKQNGKWVHNFFVSVGFDQVLHYIQLFTTYWLLK
jgi:hypothetical protein